MFFFCFYFPVNEIQIKWPTPCVDKQMHKIHMNTVFALIIDGQFSNKTEFSVWIAKSACGTHDPADVSSSATSA